MSDVYYYADLDITRTAYMECHGTGTQVGDVKETQAVTELFCKHRTSTNPLIIGSVKTNIGHLEGSAGVAGVIKGVLVVERGFIPKHLNFVAPNPKIDFEKMKLKVHFPFTQNHFSLSNLTYIGFRLRMSCPHGLHRVFAEPASILLGSAGPMLMSYLMMPPIFLQSIAFSVDITLRIYIQMTQHKSMSMKVSKHRTLNSLSFRVMTKLDW